VSEHSQNKICKKNAFSKNKLQLILEVIKIVFTFFIFQANKFVTDTNDSILPLYKMYQN